MSDLRSAPDTRISLTDTLQRAIQKQRSGDTRGARDRYRSVVEESPRNAQALVLLGELDRCAGSPQAAAAYFRAAIRIEPLRADVYDMLGKALADGGEFKAATRALLRAIEIDPTYAPAYVSLGGVFQDAERARDAGRCFAEACRIDPSLSEAHICLADSLLAIGKIRLARDAYQRGIELDPDALAPRLRLAQILFDEGELARASEQYEECLRRAPDNVSAHIGRAAVLTEAQRIEEALDSCQRALQFDPRSAQAMAQMGRVHVAREDAGSARRSFLNALQIMPELTAAQHGLAAVLEMEGRIGEALPAIRRVIRKTDVKFESDVLLARMLRITGETGEALQRLRMRIAGLSATAVRARRALELEMARVLEDDTRFREALLHYATAAQMSVQPFDAVACGEEIDRVVSFFDSSMLARLSRASLLMATPVVILGMPSAGMCDLHRAIASHSKIAPGVAGTLAKAAIGLASHVGSGRSYPESSMDARSADLDRYLNGLWPQASQLGSGSCFVVDASWSCDMHLGLVELLFPNARIIHCVRDPRDAVLGCYFRDYDGAECPFGANLPDVVARLHLHERLIRHWRNTGDLSYLTVSREALVDSPLTELQRILAFLGLEPEDACVANIAPRSRSGAAGFHTPILDPSIGRFRHYEDVLGASLNAALAMDRDTGGEAHD